MFFSGVPKEKKTGRASFFPRVHTRRALFSSLSVFFFFLVLRVTFDIRRNIHQSHRNPSKKRIKMKETSKRFCRSLSLSLPLLLFSPSHSSISLSPSLSLSLSPLFKQKKNATFLERQRDAVGCVLRESFRRSREFVSFFVFCF